MTSVLQKLFLFLCLFLSIPASGQTLPINFPLGGPFDGSLAEIQGYFHKQYGEDIKVFDFGSDRVAVATPILTSGLEKRAILIYLKSKDQWSLVLWRFTYSKAITLTLKGDILTFSTPSGDELMSVPIKSLHN